MGTTTSVNTDGRWYRLLKVDTLPTYADKVETRLNDETGLPEEYVVTTEVPPVPTVNLELPKILEGIQKKIERGSVKQLNAYHARTNAISNIFDTTDFETQLIALGYKPDGTEEERIRFRTKVDVEVASRLRDTIIDAQQRAFGPSGTSFDVKYLYDLIHDGDVLRTLNDSPFALPVDIEIGIDVTAVMIKEGATEREEHQTFHTLQDFMFFHKDDYEGDWKITIDNVYEIKPGSSIPEQQSVSRAAQLPEILVSGLTPIDDCMSDNEFPDGGCAYQFLQKYHPEVYYSVIKDHLKGLDVNKNINNKFKTVFNDKETRALAKKDFDLYGMDYSHETYAYHRWLIAERKAPYIKKFAQGVEDMLVLDDDEAYERWKASQSSQPSHFTQAEKKKLDKMCFDLDPKYKRPRPNPENIPEWAKELDIKVNGVASPYIDTHIDNIDISTLPPMKVGTLVHHLNKYGVSVLVIDFDNKVKMEAFTSNFDPCDKNAAIDVFKVTHNHIYPVKTDVKTSIIDKYIRGNASGHVSKYQNVGFDETKTMFVDDVQATFVADCIRLGKLITSYTMLDGRPHSYAYTEDVLSELPEDFKYMETKGETSIVTTLVRVKRRDRDFELIAPLLKDYKVRYTTQKPSDDDYLPNVSHINNFEDYVNYLGVKSVFNEKAGKLFREAKVLALTQYIDSSHDKDTIDKVCLGDDEHHFMGQALKAIDFNKSYFSIMIDPQNVFYSFSIYDEWVKCDMSTTGHGFYYVEAKYPLPKYTLISGTVLSEYQRLDLIVDKLYVIRPSHIFRMPLWNDLAQKAGKGDPVLVDHIRRFVGHILSGTFLKKYQRYNKCYLISKNEAIDLKSIGHNVRECDMISYIPEFRDTHMVQIKKKQPLFETSIPIGMAILNVQNMLLIHYTRAMKSSLCTPIAWKTDEIMYTGTLPPSVERCVGKLPGQVKHNLSPRRPRAITSQVPINESFRISLGDTSFYGKGVFITGRAGFGKTYLINQKAKLGHTKHDWECGALTLHSLNKRGEPKRRLIPYLEPGYTFGDIKLRAAFTNMAANLIGGMTIHKLLGIVHDKTTGKSYFNPFDKNLLTNKEYRSPSDKLYILIDECSQISHYLWVMLYKFSLQYDVIFIIAGDLEQIRTSPKDPLPIIKMLCGQAYQLFNYHRGDTRSRDIHDMILSTPPDKLYDYLLTVFPQREASIDKGTEGYKPAFRAICYLNSTRKAFNKGVMERALDRLTAQNRDNEFIKVDAYKGNNEIFREYSQPCILWKGTPVISLVTKKDKGIYAGEEGILICLRPLIIEFDDSSGTPRRVQIKNFNGWVVNWAVTGIKSQGQTYGFRYHILDTKDIIKNEGSRASNYIYTIVARATDLKNITIS